MVQGLATPLLLPVSGPPGKLERMVLLVEDSPDDHFFLKRAWKTLQLPEQLVHAPDGEAGKDLLAASPEALLRLKVIITDLKMPRCDGLQFLKWLRSHPHFHALPCVVLSSSAETADIEAAKALGANGFYTKPSAANDFTALLAHIYERFQEPNEFHVSTRKAWGS